jgi:hypothetical protein
MYDADVQSRAFASAVTCGQFRKQAIQYVSAAAGATATDTCATVIDVIDIAVLLIHS